MTRAQHNTPVHLSRHSTEAGSWKGEITETAQKLVYRKRILVELELTNGTFREEMACMLQYLPSGPFLALPRRRSFGWSREERLCDEPKERGRLGSSWMNCKKVKNWFMLSVRISSYGCTREVWGHERSVRISLTLASWMLSKFPACIHNSIHA